MADPPPPGRRNSYTVEEDEQHSSKHITVHVTALDGLVNVNSLFTIAVFLGLSLASPGHRSLAGRSDCDAGAGLYRNLVVFEVVSFSFFLFSSLVVQGLKLAINILNSHIEAVDRAHINYTVLRTGMLCSAFGSVMGCIFLVLSMISVVEVKLGLLFCGGTMHTIMAVAPLVGLVSIALLAYISTLIYAFTMHLHRKNQTL